MKNLLLLVGIPLALGAQTTINGTRVIKGTWDASGAASTLPHRTGTGVPSNRDACTKAGETYFQTDAALGQNVWICTAPGTPGTWAQQTGGVSSVFGRSGTIAPQSGDYAAAQVTNAADTTATNSFSQAQTLAGGASLGSKALTATFTNDGATGTGLNQTVKLSGAPSRAIRAATTDTGGVVGICVSGCGTTSTSEVALRGTASCVFDGATTAGDYVRISSTVAGNCRDAGVAYPSSGQVLGRVLTTNASGGTYGVSLFGAEIQTGVSASQMPALTGDVTSPAGSVVTTLSTVNASPGACGDATHVCQVTTNGKGLVTGQSAVSIAAGGGNVSGPGSSTNGYLPIWNGTAGTALAAGLPVNTTAAANTVVQAGAGGTIAATWLPAALSNSTSVNGTTIPASSTLMTTATPTVAAQEPAHTGDVTNSAGSLALTLATVNAGPGACGDATHVCQVTTNGKGLVTGQSAVSIAAGGGNVSGPGSSTNGYLPIWSGTTGTALAAGLPVSTTAAANTVVEAGAGGTIAATWLPAALSNSTSVNGTTIPASSTLMTTATPTVAAQEPAHTGDVTNSVGSLALTLATVNAGPGACGDATHVCQVTTNGKGLVTGQSAVSIAAGGGNVSGPGSSTNGYLPVWNGATGTSLAAGLPVSTTAAANTVVQAGAGGTIAATWLPAALSNSTSVNGTTIPASSTLMTTATPTVAAQEPAHTGDVTNSAGSLALTLATVNAGPGACGDATHVCQVTTNGKGLVTGQSAVSIAAGQPNQVACAGSNDSVAVSAAAVAGTFYFPANATCVVANVNSSASNIHWVGQNTTLKHLAGDTANHMLNFTGSNVTLEGFNFDLNAVAIVPGGGDAAYRFLIAFQGTSGLLLKNSTFLNSGSATGMGDQGALLLNPASGLIENITVQNTVLGSIGGGGQVGIYAQPAGTFLKVSKSSFDGGQVNQIYISGGIAGSDITIEDSYLTNVGQQAGNSGSSGNAIVVYNHNGKVTIQGNHFLNPVYSGIRINPNGQQPHLVIVGNTVDGANENSIYLEYGTEGAVVTGNKVLNGGGGITSANYGDRPNGTPNLIVGNQITNMLYQCIYAESDTVSDNSCSQTPAGVVLQAGYGNQVHGNTFNKVTAPILVDAGMSLTPNNQIGVQSFGSTGTNGETPFVQNVTPIYGGCQITGISKASSAVLTYTSCGATPTAGQVYLIRGIYGMTQINGRRCTIAASPAPTSSNATCTGLNSSSFTTWVAGPVGSAYPMIQPVYSSGTILASSMPSVVKVGAALSGQSGTIVTSDALPAPTASTLGGIQSKDCSAGGQFIQRINTDGTETCATPAGGGNVSGPGSSTSGYLPVWNGAAGTSLAAGLPVSTTAAANTVVEAGGGGTIAATWLPAALSNSTSVNGTTIPASSTLMTTATPTVAAQEPAHTGDVTNSAGSLALTLATVNASPGACGDATHVCQVTTNGKGLVTGQSAVAVAGGGQAAVYTAASGTSVTFTASTNTVNSWSLTLSGATASSMTNQAAGQIYNFAICQPGGATYTFAWPTGFTAAPAVAPTPGACTKVAGFWNGSAFVPTAPGAVDSGPTILGEALAPSGNPAANFQYYWPDSSSHMPQSKDSSGNVNSMVRTAPARIANQFITYIGTNGVPVTAGIAGADLPTPSATTLGGVQSKDCSGTGHVQKINTDGTITCSADSGGSGGGGNATFTPVFWYPYGYPGYVGSVTIPVTGSANAVAFLAITVPTSMSFGHFYANVSTGNSGKYASHAIYSSTNGVPVTKVCEATPYLLTTTGIKQATWGSTCTIGPGAYFIATTSDEATAALVAYVNGSPLESFTGLTVLEYTTTTGCKSTGTGASLAFPATLSGCSFVQDTSHTPAVMAFGQ